jgi:nuclear pore complex protein Nup54
MSLFGNNQTTNTNASPATGGSIFGNTGTQQQQPPGGGLFGGQNQGATQSTPALFGSTNQPSQTPSLFGNPGTSTNTNAPGGGGPFGGQQQTTSGGLFGGASNQQQQPPAGGLFGTSTTQQPAATGGGLFGSTTQQQQPQQQTTGGLFGGTVATQQTGGGGLFGGSKPGGMFGSSLSINTNTSGMAPSAPTTTNTNPLFGGTLGQQPQPQQQQQQQEQPAALGGIFSQTSQNQQQRPSLFGNLGQSTNPPLGGSIMGSTLGTGMPGAGLGQPMGGLGASTFSTNSLLSTRGAGVPAQQADAHAQQAKLMQRMEGIFNAWNAASPQCRFQVRVCFVCCLLFGPC